MDFLITAGPFVREGAEEHLADERRVTNELRAEGVLSAAYRHTDGGGVVGIAHGVDLEEVRTAVQRLPFVELGFLTFEYTTITPL